MTSHLFVRRFEAGSLLGILNVLPQSRKSGRLQFRERLFTFARGVVAKVVLQKHGEADQKRYGGDVGDRPLPHGEARLGQNRLERLESVEERRARTPKEKEVLVPFEDVRVEDGDEVSGTSALHEVLGVEVGFGEELGEELDDHEGLGDLRRFGRRILRGGLAASVRDGGDLCS